MTTIIVTSILLAVGMFVLTVFQSFLLSGGFARVREKDGYAGNVSLSRWLWALASGLLVGAAYYCASLSTIVAAIGLGVIVILMIYNTYWAVAEVSRWYELLVAAGIFAILTIAGHHVVSWVALRLIESNYGWATLVAIVPLLVLAICGGIVLISFFAYHYKGLHKSSRQKLDENARVLYGLGVVLSAFAAIAMVVLLIVYRTHWFEPEVQQMRAVDEWEAEMVLELETEPAIELAMEEDLWYRFYNPELLEDDDPDNDYNFGRNPLTWEHTDAEYYESEFRARLKVDPALAAADMAWLDANVGTRYLGEFYESCKGDWAKTMNLVKEEFMADQLLYYQNLDAFFQFLDSAVKVEVRECWTVSDQMYMNPYTVDGVPDIIVMLTDDHSGYELVYTFKIKDNYFEVAYRINCGYQPTDVAEIMHITPQPNPVSRSEPTSYIPETTPHVPETTPYVPPEPTTPEPTTPEPTTPEPTTPEPTTPEPTTPEPTTPEPTTPEPTTPEPTTPEPTTPEPTTPEPTTEPPTQPPTEPPTEPPTTYNKDPEKATYEYLEPNDDPGPGVDTNNPADPQHSIKDQPENSNHYESYDDYVEDIQELEIINEVQKTGEDDNAPSYIPPVVVDPVSNETEPAPVIDNNGDTGNGPDSAPINEVTPIQAPAIVADTGEPINTEPAGEWEGPPD